MLAANAKGTSVILCKPFQAPPKPPPPHCSDRETIYISHVGGHSNTERPYLSKVLKADLEKELEREEGGGWEVLVSEQDKEPFITV